MSVRVSRPQAVLEATSGRIPVPRGKDVLLRDEQLKASSEGYKKLQECAVWLPDTIRELAKIVPLYDANKDDDSEWWFKVLLHFYCLLPPSSTSLFLFFVTSFFLDRQPRHHGR